MKKSCNSAQNYNNNASQASYSSVFNNNPRKSKSIYSKFYNHSNGKSKFIENEPQNHRDFNPKGSLNLQAYNAQVSTAEVDKDGFMIPLGPVRQHQVYDAEEDAQKTKLLLSKTIDSLPPSDAFYLFKKFEEWLLQAKRKKMQEMFDENSFNKEKCLRVKDWPLSNPQPAVRDSFEDYISVISRNTFQPPLLLPNSESHSSKELNSQGIVFLLKNWTIIKGSRPLDLKLSGELRDMKNQILIEEEHITSLIIAADYRVIRTSICVYHLAGDFCNNNQIIPEIIQIYFKNGHFPAEWKEIVLKWHRLRQMDNTVRINDVDYEERYEMENSVKSGKLREPLSRYEELELKRLRTQIALDQSEQQTPVSTKKLSNLSIVTWRKQNRNEYSRMGSSQAFNELKAKNKTPMPKRKRVLMQAMSDDDMDSF